MSPIETPEIRDGRTFETIASFVPGRNICPSTIRIDGRSAIPAGDVPRTWTFVLLPSVFGILTSVRISGETSGCPALSRSMPGIERIRSAESRVTTLCISA